MNRLLPVFLLTLAAHGLAPGTLDPWRGWVAFKAYARAVDEDPDPGVSVQFTRTTADGTSRLLFLRQATRADWRWLIPVGGVVCEFAFPWEHRRAPAWDHCSFDHANFERFVDVVEDDPIFQDLIVTRPLGNTVYWEEAEGWHNRG
jgi:hypothetical protein